MSAQKPRLKTSAMIVSFAGEGQRTKFAPFGHALVELARSRQDIVGMTADLGKYTDLHLFCLGNKLLTDQYHAIRRGWSAALLVHQIPARNPESNPSMGCHCWLPKWHLLNHPRRRCQTEYGAVQLGPAH